MSKFFGKSKEEMEKIMSLMSKEQTFELLEALASEDPEKMFKQFDKLDKYAKDYDKFRGKLLGIREKQDIEMANLVILAIRTLLKQGLPILVILDYLEKGINKPEEEREQDIKKKIRIKEIEEEIKRLKEKKNDF